MLVGWIGRTHPHRSRPIAPPGDAAAAGSLAGGGPGRGRGELLVGDDIGGWWAGLPETLATPDAFRAWVEGLGAWGPIGYLLAQAAQVVVVPIPGTLFPPVGALAFGPWPALGPEPGGDGVGIGGGVPGGAQVGEASCGRWSARTDPAI